MAGRLHFVGTVHPKNGGQCSYPSPFYCLARPSNYPTKSPAGPGSSLSSGPSRSTAGRSNILRSTQAFRFSLAISSPTRRPWSSPGTESESSGSWHIPPRPTNPRPRLSFRSRSPRTGSSQDQTQDPPRAQTRPRHLATSTRTQPFKPSSPWREASRRPTRRPTWPNCQRPGRRPRS